MTRHAHIFPLAGLLDPYCSLGCGLRRSEVGNRGPGQPPRRGQPQTERITLRCTEAERAEIDAAIPTDHPEGPWIIEAALMRARGGL